MRAEYSSLSRATRSSESVRLSASSAVNMWGRVIGSKVALRSARSAAPVAMEACVMASWGVIGTRAALSSAGGGPGEVSCSVSEGDGGCAEVVCFRPGCGVCGVGLAEEQADAGCFGGGGEDVGEDLLAFGVLRVFSPSMLPP